MQCIGVCVSKDGAHMLCVMGTLGRRERVCIGSLVLVSRSVCPNMFADGSVYAIV